jgi:Holliday junction resolvase
LAAEQKVQTKLIHQLEKAGYYVIKLSVTNKTGIPDIIAIPPGSDVEFIEVKAPGKKPAPLQEYRHKELRSYGLKVSVHDGTEQYIVRER